MSRTLKSAADRQDLPVIWTVSVTRLNLMIRDVTPQFDHRARIDNLNLGFDEAVALIRERRRHEHCDVLISAGSNAEYLKNRVDLPLVVIRPDGFDLMSALTRARRRASRVGVITYGQEMPVFAAFQQQYGLRVEQRAYVTAEEARHAVAELVARGCQALVGTGLVSELAEQAGVAGVLLYSADTIRSAFESAIDLAHLLHKLAPAQEPPAAPRPRGSAAASTSRPMSGDSAQMVQLREQIRRYGQSGRTVLITGATGTGKERAAQSLHAESPRRRGPFVAVNCGAIAESLLESELFGYEEGAFTGSRRGGRVGLIEAASGGTLFLDEIGEMPLPLQTRLLRVLEEREVLRVGSVRPISVDLRVIAATHCDLERLVQAGGFRADLYYRLNVLRLRLPTLAERAEDIPALAAGFIEQAAPGRALSWSQAALGRLQRWRWPGNVRELRNICERVAVLLVDESAGAVISEALLLEAAAELAGDDRPPAISTAVPDPAPAPAAPDLPLRVAVRPSPEELQRSLERLGGDRQRLAQALGVSRTTLWRWLSSPDRAGNSQGG